ncbi:Uncharacterised protein [Raoultella ornithinolytica]|nr:Uncharacterised protein [Raoultella ornithinolytica]
MLCSPFNKLRRGDKTERARQRQLLQERVVGAFERNLQLRIAERPYVGNLVGQLQPGMALPVSQHRLEVGDRGLRIERLAVRKLHIVTQGKEPHFPVRRVAPAARQPRLDRTILLIFDQRLVDHALGKHLVGVYRCGFSGPTFTGQAVVMSYEAAAVSRGAQARSASSVVRKIDKVFISTGRKV